MRAAVKVADTERTLLIIRFIKTVNVAFAERVLENVAIREKDAVAASVTENDRFIVVICRASDIVDERLADRVTNFDFRVVSETVLSRVADMVL